MLIYEEALQLILQHSSDLEMTSEQIAISEADRRIIAEPVLSTIDLPPFLTSSVDGYAVIFPVDDPLRVVDEYPTGVIEEVSRLEKGQAVQVFTGSQLPSNTESVVMIEDTEREGDHLRLMSSPKAGDNLRRRGEELTQGQLLFSRGSLVTPPVVALLANSGHRLVRVLARLKVSVVEIGSELQAPGDTLRPGSVFFANGVALSSACRSLGCTVTQFQTTDDREEMRRTLLEAAASADVVITSGGISVGKHDHVKELWESEGAERVFWRAAIRPGKPIYFSRKGGTLIFGLPGNPVSTLVTFFLFIRPAILQAFGLPLDEWSKARIEMPVTPADLVDVFSRVEIRQGVARPLRTQGSHMLSGLAGADGLLKVPKGVGEIQVGSTLPFLPLRWSL